jgi:CheY-like chemotaxis protein
MSHLYSDRRKVLLIDQNPFTQNLRATMLRNREVEVHTAESIAHAESLWRTGSYDLVLLAAGEESEESRLLRAQIRQTSPQQRIALLVGPPVYLREVAREAKKKVSAVAVDGSQEGGIPSSISPFDQGTPSPQWQQMMQKVVAGWYSAKIQSW